ncbi:molybdenum cofactor guanylyltransferase [Siminovitchia sediminis]|uniref:Probable molybdenum cofactor guanylyltransferase n=1 Tax=Siminovitchia sediminis TaxID=1274353 RepID=A0ABW4KN53_9BACI
MVTIILAGGKSSRMGQNKALMKVGGTRVIDRIAFEMRPISEKLIVIANHPGSYKTLDALILEDDLEFKGQGPLAGIYTGLKAAESGPCLIVACDMPFASAELGVKLITLLQKNGREAVIPAQDGQIHPLFGAYHAKIADAVKRTLRDGKRSVKALLDQVNTEFFEIEKETDAFWNMNTRDDYIAAVKKAEGREKHGMYHYEGSNKNR